VKPLDDAELAVLENLAAALSKHTVEPNAQLFGEPLRRAVFALRECRRVSPAEERATFDRYFAAVVSSFENAPNIDTIRIAATLAGDMLAERRKRFGGSR
jgi:hypothetical protein